MQKTITILLLALFLAVSSRGVRGQNTLPELKFDFYGDSILLPVELPTIIKTKHPVTELAVTTHVETISQTNYLPLIEALLNYKEKYRLDDWLYYQLIRKTVQNFSPKEADYERYTVFKWFLLSKSGYGATLKLGKSRLMFYVRTDETIFNLPYYFRDGKQYVCLNYHDYKKLDDGDALLKEINVASTMGTKSFSYRVKQLPAFSPLDYIEKDIRFNYYQQEYQFKVKLNAQVKTIFANYPVVSYEHFFNIPLSKETYESLIPLLKKNTEGMSIKNGVDFLMRFTRYAFLFETDTKVFGEEKRLSPEQTLLADQSDCEDRAALFFCLVKEIYQLPMIVLAFPKHVIIGVKFDKPSGKPILYQGEAYTMVEATPQAEDLAMGKLIPSLKNAAYEVVYAYDPRNR